MVTLLQKAKSIHNQDICYIYYHAYTHISASVLLNIFIILLLDHPYSGSLRIKPQSYKQIFTMEQWDTEQSK